jgi:hypothetical protein
MRTGHSAFTWLMSFKNLEGHIAWWIQRLQEYAFSSEHRQGRKHNADTLSPMTMPRRVYSLPQSRSDGRRQACTSYCSGSRSYLGSSCSENGRTERPGHRVHSGGSRDWTALRMERHRRLQPHVRNLLGPMEIPRCEEWHTWTPVGIRRQTIRNSPDNSLLQQSERPADWTTWWTILGVNKTLNKVLQRCYWLQARNNVEKWCRQCDTYAASCGPWTRNWGQMQQYNVRVLVKRIAIDVVGPFPWSSRGNRCLLIVTGYVTKWPEAYAISNQGAS